MKTKTKSDNGELTRWEQSFSFQAYGIVLPCVWLKASDTEFAKAMDDFAKRVFEAGAEDAKKKIREALGVIK
jgi:alcohol dehydrogenase YqhD (iron-dependent ADH family)